MARLIRVKNNKGTADTWGGLTIQPGEYRTLEEGQETRLNITKVYDDIVLDNLIINNGADNVDDITDHLEAWKWLIGDNTPPQSADGDWNIINKNQANVTGNAGINWTIERELEAGEAYYERLILPADTVATLNALYGSSDRGAFSVHTCFFIEYSPGVFMRNNPWIRKEEVINANVDGAHSTGATVIDIKNTMGEIDGLYKDHYYQFYTGSADFYRKITDIDTTSEQVTLDTGIPIDIIDNTSLTLTDRPIGRIVSNHGGQSLIWDSSPSAFTGNGSNFIVLRMVNEDLSYVSVISATLNGWYGPN